MAITALLPAHNEAKGIVQAIDSLRNQTVQPDRIVVVCDNCTDNTKGLAEGAGADVFVTRKKKLSWSHI